MTHSRSIQVVGCCCNVVVVVVVVIDRCRGRVMQCLESHLFFGSKSQRSRSQRLSRFLDRTQCIAAAAAYVSYAGFCLLLCPRTSFPASDCRWVFPGVGFCPLVSAGFFYLYRSLLVFSDTVLFMATTCIFSGLRGWRWWFYRSWLFYTRPMIAFSCIWRMWPHALNLDTFRRSPSVMSTRSGLYNMYLWVCWKRVLNFAVGIARLVCRVPCLFSARIQFTRLFAEILH